MMRAIDIRPGDLLGGTQLVIDAFTVGTGSGTRVLLVTDSDEEYDFAAAENIAVTPANC
jgi:hypothetical protein